MPHTAPTRECRLLLLSALKLVAAGSRGVSSAVTCPLPQAVVRMSKRFGWLLVIWFIAVLPAHTQVSATAQGQCGPIVYTLDSAIVGPNPVSGSIQVDWSGCVDPGLPPPGDLVEGIGFSVASVMDYEITQASFGTLNTWFLDQTALNAGFRYPGTIARFNIRPADWIQQPTNVAVSACVSSPCVPSFLFNVVVIPRPLPVDLGPCKNCEVNVGGPINTTNGNTWIQQADYSLPGLGGGIVVARTWNSLWQSSSPITQAGMFGDSWRSTYEEQLQVLNGGAVQYWRSDGSAWLFGFDSVNNAYTLLTPPDERATLTFDSGTTLFTLTFLDGSKHIFNNSGFLTAVVDRNGNQTTVTYDASNRISQVIDAGGRTLTFNYPGPTATQVSSIQDSVGVVASYSYDASARLTQVTYADASAVNYAYDANGLLTSMTDTDGKVLEAHTYDSQRRGLTSVRGNGADLVTVSYPSAGTTQISDSKGNASTYGYSSISVRNFPTSISGTTCSSCGAKGPATYTYDNQGNRTSSTDALGHVTTCTYDGNGNVLTTSLQHNGSPLTWSYTYNGFGEVLTATDPLGHTTTNAYDTKGNLLTTTMPSPDGVTAGSTTSFAYDAKGELTAVTDPLGNVTHLVYTPAGLIASVTDAQSNVTQYQYDARGNRTAAIDALANQTSFAYDARNRLTTITYPTSPATSTSFTYDTRGRRTSVTDPNGKVTLYAYDDADRLSSVTDAAANVTRYAYDTENNLSSITDAAGNVTSFAYDALRRVTQTTFPSSLTETYAYDAVGNLTSKTDRKGQNISYSYDALDRLTTKGYPDSTAVNYTYDNASRLTQVTDPTGAYAFTYDNMGRLTGTSTQYSFLTAGPFAVAYGYDAASNRTSMTNPQDGVSSYTYDSVNRLISITNPQSQLFLFGYDGLSRRTNLLLQNGDSSAYSYDNLSRLLSISYTAGCAPVPPPEPQCLHMVRLGSVRYTYDAAGNRASKSTTLGTSSTTTENYSYDPIYQLTQVVQGTATTESYSYDPVGNRLSSLGVSSYSYNNSNELISTPNATFTYDNNGNTLTKTEAAGTTSYAWDFENRLASVTLPNGGGTVTLKYDPFGQRIQKSGASGTTNYVYDAANVLEEVDGTGAVLARYTQGPGIDEPLAMLRGGVTSYYLADGLGSITFVLGSGGSARYTYGAFGNLASSTGTVTNPFRYTGREFDAETGLYYYRARYYDPQAGRFISEDPIRFHGGMNYYGYAGNGPTRFGDPFGLAPGDWWDPRSYYTDGWTTLRDVGTASEAFADTLTFGSASRLNDALGAGRMVDRCGIGHKLGTASGIVASIAIGGGEGAEATEANAGRQGYEFSHWIPDRMGGPRSIYNGNYVSQRLAYLTDPFRYPAPAGAALRWGPKLSPVLQQILRVPWVYDGAAAGGTVAGVSVLTTNHCGCR